MFDCTLINPSEILFIPPYRIFIRYVKIIVVGMHIFSRNPRMHTFADCAEYLGICVCVLFENSSPYVICSVHYKKAYQFKAPIT